MGAAPASWRRRVGAAAAATAFVVAAAAVAVLPAAAAAAAVRSWAAPLRVSRAATPACDARRPGAPPGVVGAWAPPWAGAAAAAAAAATPLPPRMRVPPGTTWAIETLFPAVAAAASEERDLAATLATICYDDLGKALPDRLHRLVLYTQMRHDADQTDDDAVAAHRRATALYDAFPAAIHRAIDGHDWSTDLRCAAGGPLDGPPVDGSGGGSRSRRAHRSAATQCPAEGTPRQAPLLGQLTLRRAFVASARAAARARAALVNVRGLEGPRIVDGAGVAHPVSEATAKAHATSGDRVRREAAWRARAGWFGAHVPALAELLDWALGASELEARSIGYASALDRATQSVSIPTAVYTSLIATVRASLPRTLHKYTALRRRLLAAQAPAAAGPFELRPWDLSAPLIPGMEFRFPYDAARALVVESVAPLGGDYQEAVRKGLFQHRWVDVYPNVGKRPGAYSGGVHGTLPFILLNYDGTLDGVLTLAHEVGHSAHAVLARAAQPYYYSSPPLFVAEVASTFNEALLFEALDAHASSPTERAAVLAARVDRAAYVLFEQTRRAELEVALATAAAAGTPLTAGFLNATYAGLTAAYYGPALAADVDGAEAGWATIAHFFHPYRFYTYQYATSYAAVAALREGQTGGAAVVGAYLDALRAGGSADAMTLLGGAGVDMATTAPVAAACDLFERLVGDLAAATAALGLLPSPSPSPSPSAGPPA